MLELFTLIIFTLYVPPVLWVGLPAPPPKDAPQLTVGREAGQLITAWVRTGYGGELVSIEPLGEPTVF